MRYTNKEKQARNEEIVSAIQRGARVQSVADYYNLSRGTIVGIVWKVTGGSLEKLRGDRTRGHITYAGPDTEFERPDKVPSKRFVPEVVREVPFDPAVGFTDSELRQIERDKQAAYEAEKKVQ